MTKKLKQLTFSWCFKEKIYSLFLSIHWVAGLQAQDSLFIERILSEDYYVKINAIKKNALYPIVVGSQSLAEYLSNKSINHPDDYIKYLLRSQQGIEIEFFEETQKKSVAYKRYILKNYNFSNSLLWVERDTLVEKIALSGKANFLEYFFKNNFLKRGFSKSEPAIIAKLFDWEIPCKKDCISGLLYISLQSHTEYLYFFKLEQQMMDSLRNTFRVQKNEDHRN